MVPQYYFLSVAKLRVINVDWAAEVGVVDRYHWRASTAFFLGSLARTMCSQLHGFAGARQNKNGASLPSNYVVMEAMLLAASRRF